jgi:hypothetical protein
VENKNPDETERGSIVKAWAFSEADMRRWQVAFERSQPDDHQQFLEFVHISQVEVRSIRQGSRKAAS